MSFEIFNRKVQWSGEPAITLNKLGRISFNKTASLKLQQEAVESVLLLWDEEKRLIGVRPITKKDNRAYRISWSTRGDGCGFSSSTFLKYIGYNMSESRSFPAQWDEREQIFKIEVPQEYLKKDELVKQPMIRTIPPNTSDVKEQIDNKDLVCEVCGKLCKSAFGLSSHMRLAHSTKATANI
jgi:hypothetical protein